MPPNDFNENDESSLDKVEKSLYNRNVKDKKEEDEVFQKQSYPVKSDWSHDSHNQSEKGKTLMQSSILNKLLIVSVTFFLAATGIAAYRIFIAPILISPENIQLVVQGPISAQGGEEISFQVVVSNDNKVALRSSELNISYPQGSRDPKTGEELARGKISLGPVLNNEPVSQNISVILFGEENTEKNIILSLEYQIEGSSGTFSKEKTYTVLMSTSPVGLSLSLPPEVASGEEMEIGVRAFSNTNSILENVVVEISYPFGFTFLRANPPPSHSDNIWRLGDLTPPNEKTISIIGKLDGQDGEERSFNVKSGLASDESSSIISVIYNSLLKSVAITKPFISAILAISGDSTSPFVALNSGERVNGKITWNNNLPTRILNGEIEVVLKGDILDRNTVQIGNGIYRSQSNTLIWNQTTDRSLALIESGQRGDVSFSFMTKSLLANDGSNFKRPTIDLNLIFRGNRFSEGFPGESVETSLARTIRINTAPQLVARLTHSIGAFPNTGTIPPRAENETTYTVVWSITNSANDLEDVEVSARLPAFVNWKGNINPEGENISFNNVTGEVIWEPGIIQAGVGDVGAARDVSFQIGFLPSLNQVGLKPTLVSEIRLTGRDSFTNTSLSQGKGTLQTSSLSDPGSTSEGSGTVTN